MSKEDFEMVLVREYLSENWAAFEAFCTERGENADVVWRHIGGDEG